MQSQAASVCLLLSLVVLATSAPTQLSSTQKISFELYEHVDYKGKRESISVDADQCVQLAGHVNDLYTSLKVTSPGKVCIALFDKEGCKGSAKEIIEESTREFKLLNDKVSSCRVCNPNEIPMPV